jgi:hypothetical protein
MKSNLKLTEAADVGEELWTAFTPDLAMSTSPSKRKLLLPWPTEGITPAMLHR